MKEDDFKNQISVHFGALVPTLKEQVKEIGTLKDCDHYQKVVNALTLLHVQGYVRDKEVVRMRQRLLNIIARDLSKKKNARAKNETLGNT